MPVKSNPRPSPLGPGPKPKRWGQAPRSNFSAGVRPQSKVFELAAATFFVMKGVAVARFWGTSWGAIKK